MEHRYNTIHTCRALTTDKHTASIELSNACRQFYTRRLKTAERLREKLTEDSVGDDVSEDVSSRHVTSVQRADTVSLNNAMSLLRNELASLMGEDLILMSQLLTLNERIEELKWRQKLDSYQRDASANQLTVSACMLTDHVVAAAAARQPEVENDTSFPAKYPSPSTLSLHKDCHWGGTDSPERDWSKLSSQQSGAASTSDLGSSDDMTSSHSELRREPLGGTRLPSVQIQVNGFTHIDPGGRILDRAQIRRSDKMSFDSGIHGCGDTLKVYHK